jgi:hypothetical protein
MSTIDRKLNVRVIDELTVPPGGESEGDMYLVIATATGGFAGQEDNLAYYINAAYEFYTPEVGMIIYVDDIDTHKHWDGTSWVTGLGSLALLDTQQDDVSKVAATSILNFKGGSVLTVVDLGGGEAEVNINAGASTTIGRPPHSGAKLSLDGTFVTAGSLEVIDGWGATADFDTTINNGLSFWLGPDLNFTTDFATDDRLDATAHGMITGDGPFQLITSGTLPAGLSTGTNYWAIDVSANELEVATSYANAIAGTQVDITGDGTGTHTLQRAQYLVVPGDTVQKVKVSAGIQTAASTTAEISEMQIRLDGEASPGSARDIKDSGTTSHNRILACETDVLEVTGGERFEVWIDTDPDLDDAKATYFELEVVEDTRDAISVEVPAEQTGTTYTYVLSDKGSMVRTNNASANTTTVPPNSSVPFPIGTVINHIQTGVGQTTLAPGSGVTIQTANGLKIRAQYSTVCITKIDTDEWVMAGDNTT